MRRGMGVQVNILSTKPLTNTTVNYVLWSGKEIVGFRTELAINNGRISVYLPPEARYSQLKLIVYAHIKTGENSSKIISGAVTIPTQNYIKMTLGDTQVKPGTNQPIKFETHPGSTIAIRGVHQSLLLLSRDKFVNDISPSDVPFNPFYHAYTEQDSYSDFEGNDLLLLTNSNTTHRRRTRQAAFYDYRPTVSDYTYYDGHIRTNPNFAETSVWNQIFARGFVTDFSVDVPVVPDTVSSWFVTAMSLNANSGVAVTEMPSLLTVFRPFFITLNLPNSVMLGELFELQVIIHNYLDDLILVKVTFHNEGNIQFVDSREREMENVVRTELVEKANVGHVSFVIMPLVSGLIPLRIQAVTAAAGDAIMHPLRVEVPGATKFNFVDWRLYVGKSETHSEKYTIQRKGTSRDTRHKLELSAGPMSASSIIPAKKLNVSGLILLPRGGSGEQGMYSFARNIMALDWQAVNGIQNREMETKAKKNLAVGYQHQMQYYQPDGSFRYWIDEVYKKPTADVTWLTAYVLRCLAGAAKYITVDHDVLINGLKFLVGQQNANTGQFVETESSVGGYWAVRGVQDTQSINYAITAYVTLSIIEVNSSISSSISRTGKLRFHNAKTLSLRFLSTENSLMDSDLYNLILVTTTLAAANHTSSSLFYDKMNAAAKTKDNGNLKLWEMSPETTPSSVTIEMTAYALLANLWMNRDTAANSLPIVRWLLEQKKENGAFYSTQSSVVAFTALCKYVQMTTSGDSDRVSIDVLNNGELLGTVVLNKTNWVTPMEFLLPPDLEDDELTVFVRGKGKLFIGYTEINYIQNIQNTTNLYDITGEWKEIDDPDYEAMSRLKFCLQLRNNSYPASHNQEIYAEIKLPTGFAFEQDVLGIVEKILNEPWNTVRLIELKERDTRAIIYYHHLNAPKQCMYLPIHRYIDSTTRHPGTIRVTDFYKPQLSDISIIYPDRILTACDLCLSTNACDIVSGCVSTNHTGK